MCSLCGVLGADEHWTDAVARPGIYTRNVEGIVRHRERAGRVSAANRILALFGMKVTDWQGKAFILSGRTGKTEMVNDLGHLWQAAERLSGKICDPLDIDVIASIEADRNA